MVASVNTIGAETNTFPITIALYKGFTLRAHLFALVIDAFARHMQDEVPWCISFADDILSSYVTH